MAENPESLNSLVTHPSGNDSAVDDLRNQIRMHEMTNGNKTALDKMVEFVYHSDDQTLADLKALQLKVNDDIRRGDKGAVSLLGDEIKTGVQADQDAMQSQNSVEFYTGSLVKAVPLFAGKSKVLLAASIGFNALDAVQMKDSGSQVFADLALGGLKGFALKKTFDILGSKTFSFGAEGSTLAKVSTVAGVGLKGIGIGGLSRLYDTGLNRQNWVGAGGEVDPLQAVSMATRAAFDGRSMALDAALFMGAHGAFTGMAKLGARAIEASPLLQKIEASSAGSFVKDSKMLPSSAMGATFGFSSGAVGEVTRERQSGESLDLAKILKRGSYQALTDGAAGALGAGATRATDLNLRAALERPVAPKQTGMAFAGEDVLPPAGNTGEQSETPGDKTIVPAAVEGPAESPAAVLPEVKPAEAAGQDHVLDEAFKPIFEQSVALATAAVQPSASAEDVVSFFKYAAGDGQHVRSSMEDVAKQANDFGNVAMESLIKHAYETTPEVAATLDTGLSLAEAASRHGATAEQQKAFLDYAYGPGKGAEVPLRVAAELSGNTALDARLQEDYAGANQLQRHNASPSRISLDNLHPNAADALRTILGNLPDDAQSHFLFRQNLRSWLDLVPDHHDVVKQYAQQTKHGVVAAVVDGKLGTDYLSQFPDRSLTSPNLLDKLKGLDQHAMAPPTAQPESDGQPTAVGEQDGLPAPVEPAAAKPNPYEPAITHLALGKVVNVDKLVEEFENSDGRAKQARAYLLSDFVGQMSDKQFADWYTNGLQPSGRSDLPPGTTNFGLMRMAGLDVLERPEVAAALSDPEHAVIDFKTLKEFLSAPPKGTTAPEPWQTGFIADRIELATQRLALTPPVVGEDGTVQPIDPSKVVKEAVPSWFLKSIRDRASTFDRNTGAATYPPDFDDHLAQMLENQRYLERQNPKYRESTPPSNGFSDRVATLEKALDVQKTTTAPELVPQILKLGTGDQTTVRGILDKLDLTTNAPEYTELLKIVVPRAENIQDVKTLLDAMYFGKKSDSNAFKARKNDKPADFAERDRDANLALALAVAQKIVPPSEADGKRVQQIVAGVVSGKIRDPRPMDGPGGPGAPGGPGGRGAPGGGKEFRQRSNPPRDDRPPRETENGGKIVPPDDSVTTQPPAPAGAAVEIAPITVPEKGGAVETVPETAPEPAAVPGAVMAAEPGAVDPLLQAADLTGLLGAGGKTQITEIETPLERVLDGTANSGASLAGTTVNHTDHADNGRQAVVPDQHIGRPARGSGRNQAVAPDDYGEDDDLKGRNSKPRARDGRGHRERGGARANRYGRGFDDDE